MTNTMKNLGANAGFWFPAITTATRSTIVPLSPSVSRSPRFSGNAMLVEMPLAPGLSVPSLYDAAGRRVLRSVTHRRSRF